MAAYVDSDYVKAVGCMPAADIDSVEEVYPGTFEAIATTISRIVDSKLHKRYETPFKTPYPEAIRFHVAQIVAFQLYLKRGFQPGSTQDDLIVKARDDGWSFIKEASDSVAGLVELPIREDPTNTGNAVTRSGGLSYSEASPYSWMDVQRERLQGGGR